MAIKIPPRNIVRVQLEYRPDESPAKPARVGLSGNAVHRVVNPKLADTATFYEIPPGETEVTVTVDGAPVGHRRATVAAVGESTIKVQVATKRRTILLLGFWPPTDIGISSRHGMLWKWQSLQQDYEGSGYDVLAYSPTFFSPTYMEKDPIPKWGKGSGTYTVDYRNMSRQFWRIMAKHTPIAIMSFSRGNANVSWELEAAARNLAQAHWKLLGLEPPYAGGSADDNSPLRGHGTKPELPPDASLPAGAKRLSDLPISSIIAAVANLPAKVNPYFDDSADVGAYVSEYMAYHVAWYRDYINAKHPTEPQLQCIKAGHTHVGVFVPVADAEAAVETQLGVLIANLPKVSDLLR